MYEVVARETLDNYESAYDEDGERGSLINGCVDAMGQCLRATENPAQRLTILRALFDVYLWDVEYGGISIGDEVPDIIVEQASHEEKQQVVEWIRASLPTEQGWSESYHRRVLGSFWLDLASENMDDQTFIEVARETGLTTKCWNVCSCSNGWMKPSP